MLSFDSKIRVNRHSQSNLEFNIQNLEFPSPVPLIRFAAKLSIQPLAFSLSSAPPIFPNEPNFLGQLTKLQSTT